MKRVGVFRNQQEVFGGGDFGDHRPAARVFRGAGLQAAAPEEGQRGGEAGGEQQQTDRDDAGDEITH